ncbi:Scr1 family TA system antitoxin-like transcriptional regulator [Nonomuraea glycinis]|uniref:Scr1 family TA system antitoxin-like transcriptional regulator n=1 Tax=Nonomuraea glycinis TaxID=2047744 RepID=UPI0033BF35B7
MSTSSSAQQARQALARELRELREEAGLTAVALAAAAGWDRTKISQIEHARRSPSVQDIRTWCQICDAEQKAADLVAALHAVEGMWIEWRRMERAGLRRPQEAVRPLFERTRMFRAYSSWVVPGLIQTEATTRVLLQAVARRRGIVDDVDAAVAVRMERQRILRRGGRTFAFLIEESVLRTGVGGAAVVAAQLAHLREISTLPSVSLGVIPGGPDRDGSRPVEDFWIFDSEQVSVELVSGYLTITQPHEIAMYAQVFATMAETAVYGARARQLIEAAAETLP